MAGKFSTSKGHIALLAAAGLAGLAALALPPPAGVQIGNQATATYTDASGISRSATSNIVYTEIQQVAGVTLTADNNKYGGPGQPVAFPHTLTNTGNGDDTFDLSIVESALEDFDFTAGTVLIFPDADGNGVADSTDPADAISNTGTVVSGGIFNFVIVATIPNTAADTQTANLTVTADSTFDVGGTITADNTDTVTVTEDAIINVQKNIDLASGLSPSGPFTITLTYSNSSTTTAASNLRITDVIPAGFTYVADSGSSQIANSVLTDDATQDHPTDAITYVVVGSTVDIIIAEVAPQEDRAITFQVEVLAGEAARTIFNTATFLYNDEPASAGDDIAGASNPVAFTILPTPAVDIAGDLVAAASQASTVVFTNPVTNDGNETDIFDITVSGSSFPQGTTFVLFAADGITQLLDTNGNFVVDTGPLAAGVTVNVILKATLPPSASSGGPFTVDKTARSVNDPAVFDTATDTLTAIIAATVDVTNNLSLAGGAGAGDGAGPGPELAPVTTVAINPGQTATFTLYVNNTSAQPDSYQLAGSTDPTFATTTFPPGATLTFKNQSGTVITNTGIVLPGQSKEVNAALFFPSNTPAGAYEGYFRALSSATGASDIKHDEVVVNVIRSITIVPDNTGQVFPGGSIVYTHTIANNGNVTEGATGISDVNLTAVNSAGGFSSAIYWDQNDNNIFNPTDVLIADLTVMGGLAPGETARLFLTVFAPAGATAGTVDTATITATTLQGVHAAAAPPADDATDSTTVIAGDIVLLKKQALDADCDGTADVAFSINLITTGAIPGACIRYQVTVTNTGTAPATDVEVTDATPAYTVYDNGDGTNTPAGVAVFTKDGGATYVPGTAPADGATGTITASVGTLAPGQVATIYFGVKILEQLP